MDDVRADAARALQGPMPAARAVVGFDGYVDTMYRVVRENGAGGPVFFRTIGEFAAHVAAAAGQSADVELVRQEMRLGGNAPIMAHALGTLGMPAACIGALGHPELRPAFEGLHGSVERVSLCDPGDTAAFEFDDGKLMFADLTPLRSLDWARVKERVGPADLRRRLSGADLLALVNWGGLLEAQGIWEGLAGEVLPGADPGPRHVFVDLADISKRTAEDVAALVALLRRLAAGRRLTLGLNEHEAWAMDARLSGTRPGAAHDRAGLEAACRRLFDALGLPALVVHPVDRSYAVTAAGLVAREGRVVGSPRISTGGGDNFNAGYCLGASLGLEPAGCLELGMCVSRLYVTHGRSPTRAEAAAALAE